jgi:ubiquinone/menaquinone biosynthesis C-methylase UbiE
MGDYGSSWIEEYELVVQRDNWLYRDYAAILRELADLVLESTDVDSLIVQLGVGTANLAALLLEKRNVMGVEPSGEMARIARRRWPGLRVVGSGLRDLPFGTATVDAIVAAYTWHQLSPEDRVDSVGEMRRVLRPGGQVVVADIMFRDAASERSMRRQLERAGERARLALLDGESEEYPLLSDLRVEFGRFGFSFSGKQRTELIWLFRATLL